MTVTLRRAIAEDAPFFVSIYAQPEAQRYQPVTLHSVEEMTQLLSDSAASPLDHTFGNKAYFAILEDGKPLGRISLDITSRKHAIASVGYAIDNQFHGRGIGKAAVRELIPLAFEPSRLNLERLEAVAAIENIASRRVLEANGFQIEGIARGLLRIHGHRVDHYRFGLLR